MCRIMEFSITSHATHTYIRVRLGLKVIVRLDAKGILSFLASVREHKRYSDKDVMAFHIREVFA